MHSTERTLTEGLEAIFMRSWGLVLVGALIRSLQRLEKIPS